MLAFCQEGAMRALNGGFCASNNRFREQVKQNESKSRVHWVEH